jgi:WavE lipopolysaccharide synthesis
MTRIDSKQISVVVQGPVAGRPEDPPEKQLTRRCLLSIRRHMPQAQIVLSTWRGSNTAGLDFDELVESDDPGFTYGYREHSPYNVNRMIVSSLNGVRRADRPFAVKARSDLVFTGTGFLRYFGKYPVRSARWRVFEERVVNCSWMARSPRMSYCLHHPGDWFFFGVTGDLNSLFDIPLADEREVGRYFEFHPPPPSHRTSALFRYTAEQYVWLTFLRKHGRLELDHTFDYSREKAELSDFIIANNLVLADPARLGFQFVKYSNPPHIRSNTYTVAEWEMVYRRFIDPGYRGPSPLRVYGNLGLNLIAMIAGRVSSQIRNLAKRLRKRG